MSSHETMSDCIDHEWRRCPVAPSNPSSSRVDPIVSTVNHNRALLHALEEMQTYEGNVNYLKPEDKARQCEQRLKRIHELRKAIAPPLDQILGP